MDKIEKNRINENKWDLCDENSYKKIKTIRQRGVPLYKAADVFVGIQTLADDVFIMENMGETKNYISCKLFNKNIIEIEKDILMPIVKVSTMKNGQDVKKRIILCPYDIKTKDKQVLMKEETIKTKYPNAYKYLLENKTRLLARDKGRPKTPWYAYGREINIAKTLGDKILTSSMNLNPNFMKSPSKYHSFYSGYAIKIKENKITSDELLKQLNSNDMKFYINQTARDYQKGWKSYAKMFINDFGIVLPKK